MTEGELIAKMAVTGAKACGALEAMVDGGYVPVPMLALITAILIEQRELMAEARSSSAIAKAMLAARAA